MSQTQASTDQTSTIMSKPEKIKWGITLLLAVTVYSTLSFLGFEKAIVNFATITIIALILWATELLPDALVAFVLPVLYIVFGVGPAPKILGPWTSSTGWLILGGLMIGAFMMKTGLARRIALHSIMALGSSFVRLLLGILVAGMILAPFIPSVMGRSAILAVICMGICEALKLEKGSKEGACVILTGFIAVGAPKLAFITGGADLSMAMNLTASVTGEHVSWMEYFYHNGVPAFFYSLMSLACLLLVLRPKLQGNMREVVGPHLKELGTMDYEEKKAFFMLIVLLVFMMTDTLHGIDVGWLMLLIPAMAFLPGINLLNMDDLKKLNYPALFFVLGCMSIGSAAMASGMDKVLSSAILPILQGSELYTIITLFIVAIFLNMLLTPLAAYAALTTSIVAIALELNINPLLMVYTYSYGLDQYLFPYEFPVLLYFYATGYPTMKQVMLVCGVRMIATIGFMMCVAYPFWKFIL